MWKRLKEKVLPLHESMLQENEKIRDLYDHIQAANEKAKGGTVGWRPCTKVKAGIMQVLGFVIIALFAFMTLIGTYQIVTRYFFNRPSTVSEELLTYAFTWMALLASAYVFGKETICVWAFWQTSSSERPENIWRLPLTFLLLLAAVVMVYGGISITKLTMIQKLLLCRCLWPMFM